MKTIKSRSLLAFAIAGIMSSPAVLATNGYFSHGYSTKEKALAGAGTALSQDAMAAATNPAGMVFVGERMDAGLALFSPSSRSYKVTGSPQPPSATMPFGSGINAVPGETVESDGDFFLIPQFAYNWVLDSQSTVGVSVYGNGGMNTEYDKSDTPFGAGTFGKGTAGVNLEQLFINVSYARKLDAKNAIGASLIVAAQRFKAQGIEGFAGVSSDPSNISGNTGSTSTGAGVKLGYQGEVSPGVRIGISYQSKISMGEFDEYKGLFAEGGDFDIPSTYSVGVSFDVNPTSTIVADIQRINYTDVAAISNPIGNMLTACMPGPTGGTGDGCLGGSNGAGFGWEDMTVFKIGYQFKIDNNTYRLGYSHASQPIPEKEVMFNILAPAVMEDHITAGMTMPMGSNQEFNLALMYAPTNSVKGDNPFDGGSTQVEIEMTQYEIQAGWAWKY